MLKAEFKPRYYEFTGGEILPLHILCNYFQQAAAADAHTFGFGMEELTAQSIAWVLTRMQIEVYAPAALGKTLNVETWHARSEKALSRREFIITDSDGKTIIKGSTWWVLLNLKTRRITRMPETMLAFNEPTPRYVTEEKEFKKNIYDRVAPISEKIFLTREEDIDTNGHVNNTHYLAWATETMPKNMRAATLKTAKLSFKSECTNGEKIIGKVYKDSENSYTHILTRESDGKEVFRLTSDWE
ncbi:MAG: hypothetical protein LBI01_00070 [Elusimicrobium sp.]|jgi:acyl-ACP thioesterase|nr:hypothetical protein [Elusimicrobium sp.]